MESVPKNQTIQRAYRIPIYKTLRKFAKKEIRKHTLLYSFLDPQFDWVLSATKTGLRLAKRKQFDAIFATAPPFSTIRVARNLKNKIKIPIIADLRDPFTINVMDWPTKWHKKFYEYYWKKLLRTVDRAEFHPVSIGFKNNTI